MKVLVPATPELKLNIDAQVVVYDVTSVIPSEHADAEVLVVWQNPPWQLQQAAGLLTNLKLVQTLASGADAVLAAGFDSEIPICSGRSLHDGPVAEHALALILSAVRRLDLLLDAQRERRWDENFRSAQSEAATRAHYTLSGSNVTIWGYGSIASRLAPMLTALGAEVRGIGRTQGPRFGMDVFAQDDAEQVLSMTDILVSLIPATDATKDLFNAATFSALKAGAVFINVGRGATVDEEALIAALASGQLRAAAIDVVKTEPLESESALWDTPNLVITPHVAGNRPVGANQLVHTNIARLIAGAELVNRVSP